MRHKERRERESEGKLRESGVAKSDNGEVMALVTRGLVYIVNDDANDLLSRRRSLSGGPSREFPCRERVGKRSPARSSRLFRNFPADERRDATSR